MTMPHTREQEMRAKFIKFLAEELDEKEDPGALTAMRDTIIFEWLLAHHKQEFAGFLQEEIKHLEGRKVDERKVAYFGEGWGAKTYEEKMLVNAVLDDLISHLKEKLEQTK